MDSIKGWWEDSCLKSKRKMTNRERLSLNFWQKWVHYRRFPWKFFLNIILICLATTQVILLNEYVSPYTRANVQNWEYLIGNNITDYTKMGYKKTYHLYRISGFVDSVTHVRDMYFNLHNITVDFYKYFFVDGTQQPIPMTMSVTNYTQHIFDVREHFTGRTQTQVYNLHDTTELGPFAQTGHELIYFIHSLRRMDLFFTVKNYDLTGDKSACFQWNVRVRYDFGVRGRVNMDIHTTSPLCQEENEVKWYRRIEGKNVYIYFCLILFALVSQILHTKALVRDMTIFFQVKRQHETKKLVSVVISEEDFENRISWGALTCGEKMKFFNLWFIIATVANVCNIVGPSLGLKSLVDVRGSTTTLLYFAGLGCMFAWIGLVQYFETTSSYYVLIATLKRGTPRVTRFLLGVFPIFLGYAMFGVAFFSPSADRFATVDAACVTLFSLLNGDVIHDVFDDLYPAHPVLSRIYLYTFISLFIYAVLNIFIAIIEDAFFASKAFQLQQQKHHRDIESVDPLLLLDGMFSSEVNLKDEKAAHNHHHAPEQSRPKPLLKRLSSREESLSNLDRLRSPLLERRVSVSERSTSGMRVVERAADPLTLFLDSLSHLQEDFGHDFQLHFMQVLGRMRSCGDALDVDAVESPRVSEIFMRPPHEPGYYPCGFEDCLYCSIRSTCVNCLQHAKDELEKVLNRFLARARERFREEQKSPPLARPASSHT